MKRNAGLWVDRANAVIVLLKDEDEEIKRINSDDLNFPRSNVVADNIQQRMETENLNRYYDDIISQVSDAKAVYIIGPGEAKGELKKRMERKNFNMKNVTVETADSMTEPQIVAKIRTKFPRKRMGIG